MNGLTWNIVEDVRRLLEFHFMVNAYAAGTVVAVVAPVVGWFMVVRRQTFAGHTLSIVAFPGAAAAILAGVAAAWGYFGFCILAALVIAAVPAGRTGGLSDQPAVIGTVQAFALACGLLFVTLYAGFLQDTTTLLFGSILGITDGQVTTLLAVGALTLVAVGIMGRPLLFASVDPDVAAAAGVPVRTLAVVFLVTLGVAVAIASQVVGALLVFSLLVVPAATAHTLTARTLPGLLVAVVLGLGITWLGLACSYFSDRPVGFFVTTVGFAAYLLAQGTRLGRRRVAR